ncbi:hypothetical protein BH10BAC1_BH10BAC1_16690 [soil metagenome]
MDLQFENLTANEMFGKNNPIPKLKPIEPVQKYFVPSNGTNNTLLIWGVITTIVIVSGVVIYFIKKNNEDEHYSQTKRSTFSLQKKQPS